MKFETELLRPIHPTHKLILDYTEIPFNCNGCKEAGIGPNYSCQDCKFHLHKLCAHSPPYISHPFYKKCHFQLHKQPLGSIPRLCNACLDQVQGFVYHCNRCGFDLHPCCVNLPSVVNDGEYGLNLFSRLSRPCSYCGRKGSGWVYRSQCKVYNLHVARVKKMLVESWEAKYLNVDVNEVRELETRIPSLKGTLRNDHIHGGNRKASKGCEIVGGVVSIIMSAILGDPTTLIGGMVGGLISN